LMIACDYDSPWPGFEFLHKKRRSTKKNGKNIEK